jgi:hypothetical protein
MKERFIFGQRPELRPAFYERRMLKWRPFTDSTHAWVVGTGAPVTPQRLQEKYPDEKLETAVKKIVLALEKLKGSDCSLVHIQEKLEACARSIELTVQDLELTAVLQLVIKQTSFKERLLLSLLPDITLTYEGETSVYSLKEEINKVSTDSTTLL